MLKHIFDEIAKDCPARNKHGQCDYMHALSGDTGDCDYEWCPERLRRDIEKHFTRNDDLIV